MTTTYAYLVKDRQERFNTKRGWFVNAWRLVDETGTDLVQPWFNSRKQAREYAEASDWGLIEDERQAALVLENQRLRAALVHAAKIFQQIKEGSEITGVWRDAETHEALDDCFDPDTEIEGAYWEAYDGEYQNIWIDSVAGTAEAAEKKCREALGEQP